MKKLILTKDDGFKVLIPFDRIEYIEVYEYEREIKLIDSEKRHYVTESFDYIITEIEYEEDN